MRMAIMNAAARMLSCLDPERAHEFTIWALEHGLGPGKQVEIDDPVLSTNLWGISLPNPIGLAAGFDKNARVFAPAIQAGFGFVEVGTITPVFQAGNPKPRIFRLHEDGAVINRLGFNSDGVESAARRLENDHIGVVGANIGMNRTSADPAEDYAIAAKRMAPLVDYIAINVSSPNTPGIRALQGSDSLAHIIERVRSACVASTPRRLPPLVVKIAPDLSLQNLRAIVDVSLREEVKGLIIGNSTISRPSNLKSYNKGETGGLSGRPLFSITTELLAAAYNISGGQLPLIGTGGVGNGMDAYAKIRAGASAVQLYTALTYGGPALIGKIKRELAACLRADGCQCVADAVGADHK